jgi:hypothetical protein
VTPLATEESQTAAASISQLVGEIQAETAEELAALVGRFRLAA